MVPVIGKSQPQAPANGLSSHQAQELLKRFGINSVETRGNPLVNGIKNAALTPVNLMILAAGLISYFLGKTYEAGFIFLLLVLNLAIVFFQEYKGERKLKELREKLASHTLALRDGQWVEVKDELLVPGDLIQVGPGDTLPADCLITTQEKPLVIDDSPITGESLPKERETGAQLYSSSIVRAGKGTCTITSTGASTKFGKLVEVVSKEKRHGNLEGTLSRVGAYLVAAGIILVAFVLAYSLLALHQDFYDSLIYALAIMIAFIPSAMPAVVSTVLLSGAYDLSKKDILVKRLSSTFDLAQMDVLCSDKTGTLTLNQLQLKGITPLDGATREEVLAYALAASDSDSPDPIDSAVRIEAQQDSQAKLPKLQVAKFSPYDSTRKYAFAIVNSGNGELKVCKGAVYVLCPNPSPKVKIEIDSLYSQGYRVIAVTAGEKLVGLLSFYDPPRQDAKKFLADLEARGVEIKVVTGDSLPVARNIAAEVGLDGPSISRAQMQGKGISEFSSEDQVFAEAFPEDKYDIVTSLRKSKVVGVTGDGVNDIGAFKASNVSIAVYNAVNAAKNFSDLFLTSPGLGQLVDAIDYSRMSLKRIENYLIYRVAENIRFPVFLAASLVVFGTILLSPIDLLMLTVLNDIPIFAIATDKAVAYKKPARMDLREVFEISVTLGILGVFTSLMFVYFMGYIGVPTSQQSTMLFLKLAITGHFLLYAIHSRAKHWFENLPSNTLIAATMGTQVIATLVAVLFLGLPAIYAVYTWAFAFIVFNVTDLVKIALFREVWSEDR